MIAIVLALALAPQSLGQGLAGYWKLDEAAGSAADSSGNGLAGTRDGGVTSTAPANAQMHFPNPACAQLDGSSGVITVPDAPALHFGGSIAIAFWMNPSADSGDWQRLVGKGCSDFSLRDFGVWREGGPSNRLLFQCWGGTMFLNMVGNAQIPNGAWTHVACVYDGATATIYVNGNVDVSQEITGSLPTSPDPLTFGFAGIHEHYPGQLDEIRIYTRALSPDEVATLAAGYSSAVTTPDPSVSPSPTAPEAPEDGGGPSDTGACGLCAVAKGMLLALGLLFLPRR